MHNDSAYVKNFEQRSNNQYLPPFLCGNVNESLRREQQQDTNTETEIVAENHRSRRKQMLATRSMQQVQQLAQETGNNPFWIAISGYQPERAYLVYRFFFDIGHIVDKSFTATNLMYLKYYCIIDCDIALSYDGQKIGYGGDIFVRVKPENPVLETRIQTTFKRQSPICVIEMESTNSNQNSQQVVEQSATNSNQNSQQVVEEAAAPTKTVQQRQVAPEKTGFLKWFKQKMSYMFYFY